MLDPKRILVVDDNADMRTLCRILLEQQGFEVAEAADGDAALEVLARDTVPDLILLDIMMPQRSGWGVVAAMREDPKLAEVPVLILTARTDDDFQERAKQLGLAYMTKPFHNHDLVNTIRHILFHGRDAWG